MPARWTTLLDAAQDRLVSVLGCPPAARGDVFGAMLRRDPKETTGYWLQLLVALAIATLGLVLGSTAVIIGAMLVAPLMGPIVALGMGLAAGAPFLVLRSFLRVVGSIAVVVGGAALMTVLLPFHEVTGEISARTSPTALDLVTAAFCAVAGVLAVLQRDSNGATTAAGTSIGISLVPPLCASGFGLGTGNGAVASGAALLFLTNLVAIVVVSSVSFALAGFHQLPIAELEQAELARTRSVRLRGLVHGLQAAFRHRRGRWLRVLMPLALLALVYVPLRRALDEVSWQVQVRSAAQRVIDDLGVAVLQQRVAVGRGRVEVSMTIVGAAATAEALRARVERELGAASGVVPHVSVAAVADSAALDLVSRPAPPPVVVPPPPAWPTPDSMRALEAAVRRRWPAGVAGELHSVVLSLADGGLRLETSHLGPALGAAAEQTLAMALADDLGAAVAVADHAVPSDPVALAPGAAGLARLVGELALAIRAGASRLCVTVPVKPASAAAIFQSIAMPSGLVREDLPGPALTYRFAAGPCVAEAAAAPALP